MSAKKKSDKENQADPELEANKDTELEKKVDEMMNLEEPEGPPKVSKAEPQPEPEVVEETEEPEPEPETETEPESEDDNEPSGPPPLPGEEEPEHEEEEKEEPAKPEPTPEAEEDTTPDDTGLDDAKTNHVVDEVIAANESEPEEEDKAPPPKRMPAEKQLKSGKPKKSPLKRIFSPKKIFVLLLIALAIAAIVPASRYFALNTAGVRASSNVTVLDQSTDQPLKNAEFAINNITGKTDESGVAKLQDLKLGPTTMKINKPAFAEVSQPVTVGWGSNPLGEFKLKAVGTQFKFKVSDFLSKKAIVKAEASSGEASAVSNAKGEITLTVPQNNQDKVDIEIKAPNYRTEKLSLPNTQKDTVEIAAVPSRKHAFISKRSGTYDVYKIDADGKNEEKVLAGSANDRVADLALTLHPTKNMAAVVSKRDNLRDQSGDRLSSLTIINLDDNNTNRVAQSERIQLINWTDDKLVYVKVRENASKDADNQNQLVTYDINDESEKELATTNYFNDVLAVKNDIYYSPAAYNANGSLGLFKIKTDGTGKKTIYDREVWNLTRTSFDKVNVSMGQEYYELNLNNDELKKADGSPGNQKTRLYVEGPGNGSSLWVDDRDGKGVLVKYQEANNDEKVIQTQAGLKNPVYWLSDKHVVYRVGGGSETADYVINLEGGEARKIRDVTDVSGIDKGYLY